MTLMSPADGHTMPPSTLHGAVLVNAFNLSSTTLRTENVSDQNVELFTTIEDDCRYCRV